MADYDRALIAEMLDEYAACRSADLRHTRAAIAEQVNALLAADNADAAGVRTATQPPAVGVDVSEEMVRDAAFAMAAEDGGEYVIDHYEVMARAALHAALRTGGGAELRKVAKRNLRSMIERGSDDRELMLKCLEELS